MLVNLSNISYGVMKILLHQDETFSKYHTESVQKFRFAFSEQMWFLIFYTIFMENIKNHIKSYIIVNVLKKLIQKRRNHL